VAQGPHRAPRRGDGSKRKILDAWPALDVPASEPPTLDT
jgi:hypothetical protein